MTRKNNYQSSGEFAGGRVPLEDIAGWGKEFLTEYKGRSFTSEEWSDFFDHHVTKAVVDDFEQGLSPEQCFEKMKDALSPYLDVDSPAGDSNELKEELKNSIGSLYKQLGKN